MSSSSTPSWWTTLGGQKPSSDDSGTLGESSGASAPRLRDDALASEEGGSPGFLGMLRAGIGAPQAAAGSGVDPSEQAGLLGRVTSWATGRSSAPPEPPEWTCGLSTAQRFQVGIALLLVSAVLFAMSFFVFLPMLLFVPGKFALSFTLASIALIAAIAVFRGPRKTLTSLFRGDKLPFTGVYLTSMSALSNVCTSAAPLCGIP